MYIYYIYIDPEELRHVRWKLLHTRTHTHTHTHTQSTYLLLGEEEVDVCGVIDINFVQVCARFSELA